MSLGLDRRERQLKGWIWDQDLAAVSVPKALVLRVLRVIWVLAGEMRSGELSLRAMSLVYTTLLSLVPLLAFTFSVLKGFGVHNQMEPMLSNLLLPLGEKGAEITSRILEFVENVKVGVLGSIGLALLIYTVISLLSKIEASFNYIWQVPRARSLGQRFSEYLSVLLIGPVLVFSALGLTASMMNVSLLQELAAVQPIGIVIQYWVKLVPYLLVIGAFSFIYLFMPNTRVQFTAALTGGVVAGVLWQTTGWVFGAIVVGSTKYTAIYSSFAILIVFMIWLFLSWLILLFGASVAFYQQHPESLVSDPRGFRLSNRLREQAALLLMYRIGERFYSGQGGPTLEQLSAWLNIPAEATQWVLDPLLAQRLVVETGVQPPGYLPATDLSTVPLVALLRAVRTAEEDRQLNGRRLPAVPAVDDVVSGLAAAMEQSLGRRTLRDLVVQSQAEPSPVQPESMQASTPAHILPASAEPVINQDHVGRFDHRGSA